MDIIVTYSCDDVLPPLLTTYPGPTGKPRKGTRRRLEWHARKLPLSAQAPVSGEDVKSLGEEIGRVVALEMFRRPLATMLLGQR